MKTSTTYANQDRYLLVKLVGPCTTDVATRVIDDSKEKAIEQGYDRILFDLSESTIDTHMTRFWGGVHLAKQLPPPFKTACFIAADQINRFAENTAVNRGAVFRVFPDEKGATDWLLSDVLQPGPAAH